MDVWAKFKGLGALILMACIMFTLAGCKDSAGVQKRVAEAKARNDGPAIFRVSDPQDPNAGEFLIYSTSPTLRKQSAYWTDYAEALLNEVGVVYFAFPLDRSAQTEFKEIVAQKGRLPEGETLSDLLPELERKRLFALALNNDLPIDHFENMQPWRAYSEVLYLSSPKDMVSPQAYPAMEIFTRVDDRGKAVRYFDTTVIAHARDIEISREDQIALLSFGLAQQYDPQDQLNFETAWLEGDFEGQAKIYSDLIDGMPPVFSNIAKRRSEDWSAIIDAQIRAEGRAIAFLNAAFLMGPENLLDALRNRGLTVTRYNPADKGPVIKTIDLSIDPNRDGL